MTINKYTDKEVLDAIRSGGPARDHALKHLLLKSDYKDLIAKVVKDAGGGDDDASIVFEDALIRLDKQVRRLDGVEQNQLVQFFEDQSKEIWSTKVYVDALVRKRVLDLVSGDRGLRKQILNAIVRRGANVEDAQDCYQNGVMLLNAQLTEGKYKGGAIKGFFFQICFNLWRNETKRKKPISIQQEEMNFTSTSDGPQHALEAKERAELLEKIFAMLGESCQKILNLKFFMVDQFSMDDIAQQMGLKSAQNASNALSKCRKRLWELLNEQAFDHTYIWKKNI